MQFNIRYQNPEGQVHQTLVELHKNQNGHNIKVEGKFYFPSRDNSVIKNLDKIQDKEIWVVIVKDNGNYGNIVFATPDYFIKSNQETGEVLVEKEVPLNFLDSPEETFKWDYVTIAKCSDVEQTDKFIDILEEQGVPQEKIKEAIKEFYEIRS